MSVSRKRQVRDRKRQNRLVRFSKRRFRQQCRLLGYDVREREGAMCQMQYTLRQAQREKEASDFLENQKLAHLDPLRELLLSEDDTYVSAYVDPPEVLEDNGLAFSRAELDYAEEIGND